jgi:excisionase family DNA binding protein
MQTPTSKEQSRPHHSHLSPARARLCGLISRLSEREVEAVLGVVELFVRGPRAQVATGALAVRHAPAVPPHPPGPSSRPPSQDAAVSAAQTERRTYTVPEAAAMLGVAAGTLRKHIASGRVAVVRLGRRTLVTREAMARMLADPGGSSDTERRQDV